jgi:hypothetical protein
MTWWYLSESNQLPVPVRYCTAFGGSVLLQYMIGVDVDERKESEQIEISSINIRLGMPIFTRIWGGGRFNIVKSALTLLVLHY